MTVTSPQEISDALTGLSLESGSWVIAAGKPGAPERWAWRQSVAAQREAEFALWERLAVAVTAEDGHPGWARQAVYRAVFGARDEMCEWREHQRRHGQHPAGSWQPPDEPPAWLVPDMTGRRQVGLPATPTRQGLLREVVAGELKGEAGHVWHTDGTKRTSVMRDVIGSGWVVAYPASGHEITGYHLTRDGWLALVGAL